MLPITRANLQNVCRACLCDLSTANELNIGGSKSSLPQRICNNCLIKVNALRKFQQKAIFATGVLRLIIDEENNDNSQNFTLQMKSVCRFCLKKQKNKIYGPKNGKKLYFDMFQCTGLKLIGLELNDPNLSLDSNKDVLKDDQRFPDSICSKCYGFLYSFIEFQALTKQTTNYLKNVLDEDIDSFDTIEKLNVGNKIETADTKQLLELKCDTTISNTDVLLDIKNEISNTTDASNAIEIIFDNKKLNTESSFKNRQIKIKKVRTITSENELKEQLFSHKYSNTNDNCFSEKATSKLEYDNNILNSAISLEIKNETSDLVNETDFVEVVFNESDNDNNSQAITLQRQDKVTALEIFKKSLDEDLISDKESTTDFDSISIKDPISDADSSSHDSIENDTSKRKQKIFKCKECNKIFHKKFMHDAHYKGVHEGIEEPYTCSHCFKTFRHVKAFQQHVRVNHSCSYCKQTFETKEKRVEHIIAMHEKLKPFKCNFAKCEKTFATKIFQIRHEKIHFKKRQYSCEHCWQRFGKKLLFDVHIQHHKTNPDLICPVCKIVQLNVEDLEKHVQIHTKTYQCTTCGKIFQKLDTLREHENTVHLKMTLKCSYCDLTFSARKSIKLHELCHTSKEWPEECKSCKLYFKSKHSLLMHIKKIHTDDSADDHRETCTICLIQCKTRSNLLRHIKNKHPIGIVNKEIHKYGV